MTNANASVYLDTSVLAKWYLSEANSEQVTEYIISLNQAAVSSLTKTEMRCLLARRKRMPEISTEMEAQIYATFLDDISQGHLVLYNRHSAPSKNKHSKSIN